MAPCSGGSRARRRWWVLTAFSMSALVTVACDKSATPRGKEVSPPVAPISATQVRPGGFADIVERVRPAVVNIYTGKPVKPGRNRFAPGRGIVSEPRLEQSLGSGFVIDTKGSVVTNHHVIAGASALEARLLDGRRFSAKVLGSDE